MALTFEISGAQIDGARDYQEDAFLITHLTDDNGQPCVLVIVADGMGGHAAGNVASNLAVQACNKHISAHFPDPDLDEVLNAAILKANHSIAETIQETPALEGMGCTMVAAVLQGNQLWWASVGDSHLYLMRDRELRKVNADHSYGGFLDAMAAAGTPMDPEPGLSRNMLMSAITGDEIADIDCPSTPLELGPGDKLVICTDGMDTLSEGKLIQYCDWSDTPKECAESLLNAVEEAEVPRQDNTTVVVVNVVDKDAVIAASEPETALGANVDVNADTTTDLTDTISEEIELSSPEGMPEPVEEAVAEEEEEPEEKTEIVPPPPPPKSFARRYKQGKGLWLGLAAVILISVGVAGYFMLGTDKVDLGKVTSKLPMPEPAEPAKEPEPEIEQPIAEEPEPEPVPTPPTKPAKIVEFRDSLSVGGSGPVMVWIPAGSYQMGSPDSSNRIEERPRHDVTLKKFAISKYEVTFAEYDRFASSAGRRKPPSRGMDRKTSPVTGISWNEAAAYAAWLAKQTGKKYRLASESQWEYVASGGQVSPFWWGFSEEPGKAHCFACESPFNPTQPAKVGSFAPNQFGVHDTAGNVAEWVADCWHPNYTGAPTDGSIWPGGDCTLHVVRGGSFNSPPLSIRRTSRDKLNTDSRYDHVGLRVTRE